MKQPDDAMTPAPSDEELRAVLEDVLRHYFGAPYPITRLERRPSPYRTSFALEEITVFADRGDPLRMMFKDLSRQSLLHSARLAKPRFLYDPMREIETYRILLAGSDL